MNVLSMLAWWQLAKDHLRPFPKTIGPAGPWKLVFNGDRWYWIRFSTVAPIKPLARVYLDCSNDIQARVWRHDSDSSKWDESFDRRYEHSARRAADERLEWLYGLLRRKATP